MSAFNPLHRPPIFLTDNLIAVIGLVLLLWDHVLTFEGELTYIWRLPFELTKVVFVFNRYFVEGALLLVVYGKSEGFQEYTSDLTWGITVLLGLHAAPLSQEVSPYTLSREKITKSQPRLEDVRQAVMSGITRF